MTGVIITPDLEKSCVQRRGIVTVPGEMATASCSCPRPCQGLVVNDLPLTSRMLEVHLREMGNRMIERLGVRGYQWLGELRLHGPFPSYEFNQRLADIEAEAWKRAVAEGDLSYTLPFVIERDATGPYKDYLLVGNFLLRNVFIEVEEE